MIKLNGINQDFYIFLLISYNFWSKTWLSQKGVEKLWNQPVPHKDKTSSQISWFSQESFCVWTDDFVKQSRRAPHQNRSNPDISQFHDMVFFKLWNILRQSIIDSFKWINFFFNIFFVRGLKIREKLQDFLDWIDWPIMSSFVILKFVQVR